MDFWRADDEVAPIAQKLIAEHKPELQGMNIAFIFREKCGKKGEKLVIGTAKKVSSKDNVAHSFDGKPELDFIIELGHDAWQELNDDQRQAVILHELCHCGINVKDDGSDTTIQPHEVEEFSKVIEVFGCYTHDIQKFVDKALESKDKK